ncbi:helix-turn-helix domain-containing protein, partial [Escherichia coli]
GKPPEWWEKQKGSRGIRRGQWYRLVFQFPIRERTNEGRQEAKLKGIKFGRRRTVDRNVVLTLHQKGTGATEIAHQLSIARSTVYKILEDERAS